MLIERMSVWVNPAGHSGDVRLTLHDGVVLAIQQQFAGPYRKKLLGEEQIQFGFGVRASQCAGGAHHSGRNAAQACDGAGGTASEILHDFDAVHRQCRQIELIKQHDCLLPFQVHVRSDGEVRANGTHIPRVFRDVVEGLLQSRVYPHVTGEQTKHGMGRIMDESRLAIPVRHHELQPFVQIHLRLKHRETLWIELDAFTAEIVGVAVDELFE